MRGNELLDIFSAGMGKRLADIEMVRVIQRCWNHNPDASIHAASTSSRLAALLENSQHRQGGALVHQPSAVQYRQGCLRAKQAAALRPTQRCPAAAGLESGACSTRGGS